MRRECSGRRAILRPRDAIGMRWPDWSTLCAPAGLMIDVLRNLWVADTNNDRVLEYAAPFSSDSTAAMVIGQGDSGNFATAGCDAGIAPATCSGWARTACARRRQWRSMRISTCSSRTPRTIDRWSMTLYSRRRRRARRRPPRRVRPHGDDERDGHCDRVGNADRDSTSTATPTASPTRTPQPGGKLKLHPKSIKFGKVTVGSHSAPRILKIQNAGTVTMEAAVPTQGAPFVVNGGEFIVSPHGSMAVTIEFAPTAKGACTGCSRYKAATRSIERSR